MEEIEAGMKLSLFSEVYGKKDSNPEALSAYLASELTKLGVLYLHVFKPRDEPRCLKSIRKAFEGTLIASGGYNKTEGDEAIAESYADLVSFGRLFLANLDLPKRSEVNAPLTNMIGALSTGLIQLLVTLITHVLTLVVN